MRDLTTTKIVDNRIIIPTSHSITKLLEKKPLTVQESTNLEKLTNDNEKNRHHSNSSAKIVNNCIFIAKLPKENSKKIVYLMSQPDFDSFGRILLKLKLNQLQIQVTLKMNFIATENLKTFQVSNSMIKRDQSLDNITKAIFRPKSDQRLILQNRNYKAASYDHLLMIFVISRILIKPWRIKIETLPSMIHLKVATAKDFHFKNILRIFQDQVRSTTSPENNKLPEQQISVKQEPAQRICLTSQICVVNDARINRCKNMSKSKHVKNVKDIEQEK
ncbi:hypothetical protein CVS40_9810 [Lucilia cuprina]|nr:hypothetical protein CVS40_9810 [Lucilia cuprina]